MSDRFKEAENWLIDVGSQADGSRYGEDMCKILYEALTLATEAEQLRKERDELASAYDPDNAVRFNYLEDIKQKALMILAKKVTENENV